MARGLQRKDVNAMIARNPGNEDVRELGREVARLHVEIKHLRGVPETEGPMPGRNVHKFFPVSPTGLLPDETMESSWAEQEFRPMSGSVALLLLVGIAAVFVVIGAAAWGIRGVSALSLWGSR